MKTDRLINLAIRAPASAAMRVRILRLRAMGMTIGRKCWVRQISVPRNPWDVALADHVSLDDGVILLTSGERTGQPRIRIGRGVYINRHVMIDASEDISIGANTMIGPFVYITDHDHGTKLGLAPGQQPLVSKSTRIGENVWIGANAVVLKGVTVGDNAIIGAGAVVTADIACGSVATGIPARTRSRKPT